MDTGGTSSPVAAAVLERDQPCIKCGYQLRGLPESGVCPECGTPVADSLRGVFLAYASAEYRQKVGRGLSLILNAILATIVLAVLSIVVGFAAPGPGVLAIGLQALSLAISAASIAGYWWYTEPDPGYTGLEKPNSARQTARIAVIVGACVQGGQLLVGLIGGAAARAAGTGSSGAMAAGGLVLLLGFIGLVALVAQFFSVMQYTRWMGSRVPDRLIERRAGLYLWLLPVLSIVGAILLMLGPLVALILYWNLLNRLREHLRSINKGGVPANLPGVFSER